MSIDDWCDGGCAPDECVCVSQKLFDAYEALKAERDRLREILLRITDEVDGGLDEHWICYAENAQLIEEAKALAGEKT